MGLIESKEKEETECKIAEKEKNPPPAPPQSPPCVRFNSSNAATPPLGVSRKIYSHKKTNFHHLPKRVILIRHGESIGNVNEKLYEKIADWRISLTQNGIEQAEKAGREIKELIGEETVQVYCSPYLRTKQVRSIIKF